MLHGAPHLNETTSPFETRNLFFEADVGFEATKIY